MTGVRKFSPQFSAMVNEADQGRCVLVAGGAGFIGSNLCDRLIAQGDRVICIDNLETGRSENIAHLIGHPGFAFFLHDIIEPFQVEGPVERIYNLACPASPPKYQRDPVHTFKTSVLGALNLLELARLKGARILQSSTSEVYGDPDVHSQNEDYRGLVNTVGPRSCYDEGKRAAETLFHDVHERDRVDIRIARIFNTYGPRMDPEDGRVVSNFVVQALSGLPLTIYGDGQQTRSFCYIDDMLDGLTALMETDTAGYDPVNLGNPGEFTMRELAEIVLEMTGAQVPVTYCDLPRDDPHQRCPDITRARRLLGWAPRVPLREGLAPTIAYFRDQIRERQQLKENLA
ncbi:NAD-dependent dehydratase [Pseudothioclava arenosa]|uniref:UDP-glucuronate decarboxylase n=2 Tax=Pseudothioclava arenosa TaxID=1795308 RepID=A0A2A4CN60_9RHOB|nr:NAD-dependent dehydratase [Pseudothioclava arenosa]